MRRLRKFICYWFGCPMDIRWGVQHGREQWFIACNRCGNWGCCPAERYNISFGGRGEGDGSISLQDYAKEHGIDLGEEQDVEDVRAARAEAKEKGTIPWEQVKKELGLE